MTKLLEQLPLVHTEVDDTSITFDFLNREEGTVYEVKWNLKKYNEATKKYVEDAETLERVNGWAKEYFDTDVEGLNNLPEGITKDIYHSGRFNSLWKPNILSKFDKDRVGEILNVEITEVYRDNFGLKVKFEEDGNSYAVNFGTSKYYPATKETFKDASKEIKSLERFEGLFGVPFEKADILVGESMMIEIRQLGIHTFAEAKKFSDSKKAELKAKI